ncbi:glycoside hydrolase family 32 protein [Nesterenkonia sp. HG001]|uniref:glycoside hydrolase family 32 protein n=1 Tax=Nesterenkonia sp. HG001 TaxID=2983207 RepID=UPI002AC372C9|nr:glycoside hydrolase family 32 protein [Nesterenkonia sp. HG001]MDZ5076837.1 glycoside hydrolase family 32 protein [Nesterenkonia sp. HG001]
MTSSTCQPAVTSPATASSAQDLAFPVAHPRPARGWLNDPNGLCRVNGTWHVFFQFNPHSARHEHIHWGHLSSPDLVEWTEEPVALTPGPQGPDVAGCWSGVMGFDDGAPIAVYSGVQGIENASEVTLARGSADLREWSQERHVAAPMPEDEQVVAVRDPFLVTIDGRRWALQGAGLADGRAAILLYDAEELTDWTYHGVWLSSDRAPAALDADIWECPQLVWLEDSAVWVLVVSRWHRTDDGGHELDDTRALLLEVDLPDQPQDLPRPRILGESEVDTGSSFYAPQVLAEPDRALMIGWAREQREQQACDEAGWSGLLTWPRELQIRDGALVSSPAAECEGWRLGPAHHDDGAAVLLPDACDVVLPTTPEGTVPTVELRAAGDTDAEAGPPVYSGPASRIVIDHSIIEIFRADGPACTLRAYPAADQQWELRTGGARLSWWVLRRWSPA